MTREKKLGTGLYFSAEEFIPALLLVLCSFLKTAAITTMDAGASVWFLSEFLGQDIPQVLIGIAFLTFLIWPAFSAVKEKSPLIPVFLLFTAAGISLSFYVLSFFVSGQQLGPFAMIWKEGFRILAETAFWLTAFRFGIFKGKPRLLAAVLIAQIIGLSMAAGMTGIVGGHCEALFFGAAVLAVLSALTLKVLIDNGSAPILHRFTFDKQKIKRKGNDSSQRKLSFYFFVSSGILFFAAGVFRYYFMVSAAEFSIGNRETLAAVYGSVFAASAFLGITAIYAFSKSRTSLFAGLFLSPLVLFIAWTGGWTGLFGLIAAAQAVSGLAGSMKEMVFQAVPVAVSLRTGFRETVFRKTIVEPLALALSGIFLLVYEQTPDETYFLHFLACLTVVSLIAVIIIRNAYLKLILNMLKSYLWRGGKLLLTGKKVKNLLQDNLNNGNTENVLYTLRVIEESATPFFLTSLKQALRHSNDIVRLYALTKTDELKLYSFLDDVILSAEKDENIEIRREAIRVMCRLGTPSERERAVNLLNDPDLREGALTGLLAVGREGVFRAIKTVADLSVSENRNDRLLTARVLGNAGNAAFYQPLTELMNDPDTEVCIAALNAAGKLKNPLLLPAVMETFRYPELRETAGAVLSGFKEKAFDSIAPVLNSRDYPVQFRILLVRLVGHIASPAAEEFLFSHIQTEDRRVRFHILKTLALSGYKATGKKINIVRLCLYDEMETATGILAALHSFDKNKDEALSDSLAVLKDALKKEIEYIRERILLSLALLQPSSALINLLSRYTSTTPKNDTLKIIDKILSGELRRLCLPLFEDKTVQEQLTLLRPHFYPPILPAAGHILEILKTAAGEMTDWTRACAAYAAGYIADTAFINSLTLLLSDPDPIVRETAIWAIGKTLPRNEAARLISGNLEDFSIYVARMARFVTDGSGQIVF